MDDGSCFAGPDTYKQGRAIWGLKEAVDSLGSDHEMKFSGVPLEKMKKGK